MYKRYGKFQMTDYMGSWIGLVVMIIFFIACLLLRLSVAYIIVPVLYFVALIYSIWKPNREYFEIIDDIINIKNGKRIRQIRIPRELSMIVSPVDISPPFTKRNAVGNQTHILKGKYALSILTKMDMDEIVERVHRGYIKRYTTSTIKSAFEEHRYLYSFVCNEVLLNEITRERKVNLLVPKSMLDKISLENQVTEIYIDPMC